MDPKPSVIHYDGYCFVADCPSKRGIGYLEYDGGAKLHFFEFPKTSVNPTIRRQWVLFCARSNGKGDLLEPGCQKICSRHFKDEDITKYSTNKRVDKRKPLCNWRVRDSSVFFSIFPPVKSHPFKCTLIVSEINGKIPTVSPSAGNSTADKVEILELCVDSPVHLESLEQIKHHFDLAQCKKMNIRSKPLLDFSSW